MAQTFQEAWDELVMKCQYDTKGMVITEFQKSVIVWADKWVRIAQQSTQKIECDECGSLLPEHFANCSRQPT